MSAGPNNLKTKSPHFERGDRAQSYPSSMDESRGRCLLHPRQRREVFAISIRSRNAAYIAEAMFAKVSISAQK
jgi:hypothetical protein